MLSKVLTKINIDTIELVSRDEILDGVDERGSGRRGCDHDGKPVLRGSLREGPPANSDKHLGARTLSLRD